MNIQSILRKRKAVSQVTATILLIAITITAVGIVAGVVGSVMSFKSNVISIGDISAEDVSGDGSIDFISIPLMNKGMSNAIVEEIVVYQNNQTYLWYSFINSIKSGDTEDMNIYALGELQELKPLIIFQIEIVFEDSTYLSYGYVAYDPSIINNPDFDNRDYVVLRTPSDDAYGSGNFPAETGFSPTLWFLLGEFEDDKSRPNLNTDYISLCGQGNEEDYRPYLLDMREFTQGNIGTQSNHLVMPYNDSGDIPGLIDFTNYGSWDKSDQLYWGSKGIVYMWTYIYLDGATPMEINVGANGASEYKVWVNGEEIIYGNTRTEWYTKEDVTFNPGLNIIMMKISARTDAHFAGQVLLYNDAISSQIAYLYSMWPTINEITF